MTDIEGTTTPISFVHRTLFPFARAALPALLRERSGEAGVADALAEVGRLAPGQDPLTVLLGWMDADAKITPLKQMQGIVWQDGFEAGLLRGELYPDVAPALHAWRQGGTRLAVYSSGSEVAQRLLFGHSQDGDLAVLFERFFDTRLGAKREAASYRALAASLQALPHAILFLSDVEAELDAAAAAGLRTCQLVRPDDGTVRSTAHPACADFAAVARQFGLAAATADAAA